MNVYCLYFPNGKRYVGVESKTGSRIAGHIRSVRSKKKFQLVTSAIAHHGWDNVQWRYLATNCDNQIAWALERFFINIFRTRERDFGYNRSAGGESGAYGYRFTPEQKAHLSSLRRGKKRDPEIGKKVAAAQRGRVVSCETRLKMSTARTGKEPWNKGTAGMGISPASAGSFKKGHVPTAEHRRNQSLAQLGKTGYNLGKLWLPAGPNGERRYFFPEQIPYA